MSTVEYQTTIGLEMHVELSTASKMFCGCRVDFGGEPNTRTCPVCLGLPGSLPVPNEKALEYTARIASALNCTIARNHLFHRKNYFYPDMPKNYQISQYDLPLGTGGSVEIQGDWGTTGGRLDGTPGTKGGRLDGTPGTKGGRLDGTPGTKRVGITRVHLEEDTGKSLHVGGTGRIADSTHSLEDFNRAGTPLVEIVSEPDIGSAAEARAFVTELRAIIESLGVSDVRMEEGSLRVDANISTRIMGAPEYGAKVEVKNMNSIRSVARALEHEEMRQRKILDAGETFVQQTRHFDEKTGTTSPLRTKEFAFDYRYFPEPDMVPFEPTEEWIGGIEGSLPELPAARRERLVEAYGLGGDDVEVLTATKATADWFEEAAEAYGGDAKRIVNWIIADLFGLLNEAGIELHETKIAPGQLASMVKLVDSGSISGKQAKSLLAEMFNTGKDPKALVGELGLEQVSDEGEISSLVDQAIADNLDVVEKIRSGNLGPLGFLVGDVMKRSKGKANPGMVNDLLKRKLS